MVSLNDYLQGYESDDPPNEQWNEQFEEEELNEQPHDHIPLPPGLQTQRFNSYDEVIELLNNHGRENGYAVNKKRVKKVKSGSHTKTVWIKCDRSQYACHVKEGQRKRKTSTIKTDCPFEIITRLSSSGGAGKQPIEECTGAMRNTMGLPCIHTIKHYYDRKKPIMIAEFDNQWRLSLTQDLPSIDPRISSS